MKWGRPLEMSRGVALDEFPNSSSIPGIVSGALQKVDLCEPWDYCRAAWKFLDQGKVFAGLFRANFLWRLLANLTTAEIRELLTPGDQSAILIP